MAEAEQQVEQTNQPPQGLMATVEVENEDNKVFQINHYLTVRVSLVAILMLFLHQPAQFGDKR